jgi:Uma2 family endonuclease
MPVMQRGVIMSAQPHLPQYTPDEYFAMSAESGDVRLEYDRGTVYAMTGGSPDHSLIQANLIGWFKSILPKPACRVHTNDMRVGLPGDAYYYPDLSVVCGKQQFEKRPDGQLILLNPLLVVEILSKSTQRLDRTRKYDVYTSMPSVQHYLIVAQENTHVTYYQRTANEWVGKVANALLEGLELTGIGTLPVETIYEQVSWLSEDDF